MNKQRKRAISPFCSKLVLTIGFLICVPMLLIQILLFVSSYSTLHRQNDQYYYLKTQSLSSRFSAQLAGFRKIALKISSASYTSSLKKFESDPSPYRMLKISEELKAIADTNYLASGVGIYYPRQDVALNSSVYYTLDTLCIRLGENDPAVRQRVEAALSAPYSGGTSLVFFPSNSARTGRMLITLPVKLNRYDDYDAVVYFVVNQSDMATALSGDAPSENSLCAIFSQEGELLYASGGTDLFAREDFQAYLADPTQMSRTFSEETAYKWQDSGSPYLFVTLVGQSELEENARAFFQRMGILLLINVVTVAAMICLTAYINYSPLRRLVSRVGAPGQGGSEFDQLEQIIRDLDSRAADQGVVIMDYVLNDLLYGMPVNQPELERLIPNFHFRYFCAVSVTCRPPSPVQSEQISRRIEEGTGCRSYITDMPHKDTPCSSVFPRRTWTPPLLETPFPPRWRRCWGRRAAFSPARWWSGWRTFPRPLPAPRPSWAARTAPPAAGSIPVPSWPCWKASFPGDGWTRPGSSWTKFSAASTGTVTTVLWRGTSAMRP